MERSSILTILVCTALAIGCGEDAPKDPITIGLLTPITDDFPAAISDSFERVANTAIEEINDNGGVNGHELRLIVRDSWPIGAMGPDPALINAAIEDVSSQGAVGAVGPVISLSVALGYEKAKELKFPLISPSSTAPELAEVDDGGFVFRNATNDNVQSLAVSRRLAQRSITEVHLMYQDDPYGQGLANAFTAAFESADDNNRVLGEVKFPPTLTPEDADTYIEELKSKDPSFVVLISLQDALLITQRWAALPDGERPDTTWFFTDGARTPDFLAAVPEMFMGAEGTAPTNPILGDAFGELDDAWSERYPDEDIRGLVFTPQVWDGVYLLAAGLVVQSVNEEPFGGDGLRRAISEVSSAPGVILHAGQWRDFVGALRSDATVDFDGASGPTDFDRCGETIGSYEVWTISEEEGGTDRVFAQASFLDGRVLALDESLVNMCPEFN